MDTYKEFDLGQRYYASPFWSASHRLYRMLNPNGPANGFLWNNAVKFERNNRRPDADIEDMLMRVFNPLAEEIRISRPDVVVFFHRSTLLRQASQELAWSDENRTPPESH